MSDAFTLVVLRHAKAERADGGDDHLRPLALQGRKQASRLGAHLSEAGLRPDVVLCSSALRTRQTWELARTGLGAEPTVQVRDDLYAASPTDLLAAVREVDPEASVVLVVGHEPSVSALAAHLAGEGSDSAALAQVRAGVPTATYSVLRSPEPWTTWVRDSAVLDGVYRPEV